MEKCKFFFVLYFLLAIQFSHKVEAFYVPGVAPVEFDKGEPVEIKVSPYFVFIFIIISRHAYEVSEAGIVFIIINWDRFKLSELIKLKHKFKKKRGYNKEFSRAFAS